MRTDRPTVETRLVPPVSIDLSGCRASGLLVCAPTRCTFLKSTTDLLFQKSVQAVASWLDFLTCDRDLPWKNRSRQGFERGAGAAVPGAALATTLTTTRTTRTTTTTDVAKERLEGRPRKAGRAAFRRRRLRWCYATTRRAQDNEAFHFEIARLEQRLQELAKAR